MPTLATAEDLVNNPKVLKYIDAIDCDADAALDLAKSVISSPTGKLYSSSTLSSYKADVTRLDTCWGKFNSAFNKVANGRAKDNKEIIKTYHKYVLALEILEESNTRHQAMMTTGFALAAAAFLKMLIDWQKAINKTCKSLETELAKLEALVKRAKLQVAGASAQAALNLTLTGVTMCMGPAGWGARIGLAAVGLGAHLVIDAALGSSSGSALGTVNTAASEAVSLAPKLDAVDKKLLGGVGAVLTLKLDVDEIGDSVKIMKEVQAAASAVQSRYLEVKRSAAYWNKDIGKRKAQYDSALKAYQAAASRFRSSKRQREQLLREFKQWK